MVQFAPGRYAGVVVGTSRFNRPGSLGAWIWNRGQDLWALSLPALIVLKLTGVIAWSWWWVLSPLWISGILLAPVLFVLLALLGWHIYRTFSILMSLRVRSATARLGLRSRVIRFIGLRAPSRLGCFVRFAWPPGRLFSSLRVICGEYRHF